MKKQTWILAVWPAVFDACAAPQISPSEKFAPPPKLRALADENPRLSPEALHQWLRGQLALKERRIDDAVEAFQNALVFDAQSAQVHAALAEAFLLRSDPSHALASAESALTVDPHSPEAHRARAIALRALGRPREAESSLRAYLAAVPAELSAAQSLAELLWERSDLAGARGVTQTFARAAGDDPQALALLALICVEHKAWECARAELEPLWAIHRTDRNVCALRASVLAVVGGPTVAAAAFQECAALDPDAREVASSLLLALGESGQVAAFDAALPLFLARSTDLGTESVALSQSLSAAHAPEMAELAAFAALRFGDDARLRLEIARAQAMQGHCKSAQSWLGLLSKHPEFGDAASVVKAGCEIRTHSAKAALQTLLLARGLFGETLERAALECAAHAALAEPAGARLVAERFPTSPLRSALFRAHCLDLAGAVDESVDVLKMAAEESGNMAEGVEAWARAEWRRGNTEQAERLLRSLVALNPDHAASQPLLARVLAGSAPDEAMRVAQRALARSPQDAEAWAALGSVQTARGDWAEALRALTMAAERERCEPQRHADLGDARLRAQDFAGARKAYQRALDLKPIDHQLEARMRAQLAP